VLLNQVRPVHLFFTHRSVSTFDRVGPFQLTDALFSYGAARSSWRRLRASAARSSRRRCRR
jgi:hypothetical protein